MVKKLEKLDSRIQFALKIIIGVAIYFLASGTIRAINPRATWIWAALGILGVPIVYLWVRRWQKPARNALLFAAAAVIIVIYALLAR